MNHSTWVRIQCAIVLLIFMVASLGPIPITSSICFYVVIFRPRWFKALIDSIYADKAG
ncbi:hypothetical protein [Methylomonas sp. MgM2]